MVNVITGTAINFMTTGLPLDGFTLSQDNVKLSEDEQHSFELILLQLDFIWKAYHQA